MRTLARILHLAQSETAWKPIDVAHAFGHLQRSMPLGLRQHDAKLVAAEAEQLVEPCGS